MREAVSVVTLWLAAGAVGSAGYFGGMWLDGLPPLVGALAVVPFVAVLLGLFLGGWLVWGLTTDWADEGRRRA